MRRLQVGWTSRSLAVFIDFGRENLDKPQKAAALAAF